MRMRVRASGSVVERKGQRLASDGVAISGRSSKNGWFTAFRAEMRLFGSYTSICCGG